MNKFVVLFLLVFLLFLVKVQNVLADGGGWGRGFLEIVDAQATCQSDEKNDKCSCKCECSLTEKVCGCKCLDAKIETPKLNSKIKKGKQEKIDSIVCKYDNESHKCSCQCGCSSTKKTCDCKCNVKKINVTNVGKRTIVRGVQVEKEYVNHYN